MSIQMNQKEKFVNLMKVNELESNKIIFNHINAGIKWKKLWVYTMEMIKNQLRKRMNDYGDLCWNDKV